MPPAFARVPNSKLSLPPGQAHYAYDAAQGGSAFVVEVVRIDEQPKDFLVLEVTAWEVDDDGSVTQRDGSVVATPPRRVSIHLDALAEGSTTVPQQIERATQHAADRLARVRAQLASLAAVPKRAAAPRPGGPS